MTLGRADLADTLRLLLKLVEEADSAAPPVDAGIDEKAYKDALLAVAEGGVKHLQSALGVTADGKVGPVTDGALDSANLQLLVRELNSSSAPPPLAPGTTAALKTPVANRGVPPQAFLNELIAWGKTAPDVIFEITPSADIYNNVFDALGPWENLDHRRAVMLEVLRVLAGFESSWNWNAGVDVTNPSSNTPDTAEAGAWQTSANSRSFGDDLKALIMEKVGSLDGAQFQRVTKRDHVFAMEYTARLLRHTVNHHGPVKRHEIDQWLSRDAVAEFQAEIA